MRQHRLTGFMYPLRHRSQNSDNPAGAGRAALSKLIGARNAVDQGRTIAEGGSKKQLKVLLNGIACLATLHEGGHRQIELFYYPGDLLGLHLLLFPQSPESSTIEAVTDCSVGALDCDMLDQGLQQEGLLGRALWQAAMKEASIFRRHLVVARRPALERVAHLLCEQLTRMGIERGLIPLTQKDVADAAGLSVVHTNRIFQELRELGVLARHGLEVVNAPRLKELGSFDGDYLDANLPHWDVRIHD